MSSNTSDSTLRVCSFMCTLIKYMIYISELASQYFTLVFTNFLVMRRSRLILFLRYTGIGVVRNDRGSHSIESYIHIYVDI